MAREAVSIENAFKEASRRLHEAIEAKKPDSSPNPEGVAKCVTEAIASELGVPLDPLIQAAWQESVTGIAFLLIAGPRRVLCTSSVAAFLAGVTWEQGRSAPPEPEQEGMGG